MSQGMMPQQPEFHFPSQLELDGNIYNLVYDPGNPARPQVMPNYRAMLVRPSSNCEPVNLGEMGVKYLAIVDAVLPAMTAQQAGGFPVPEKQYLCFKLADYNTDPVKVDPRELVIYERRQESGGSYAMNRAQRLLNAIMGSTAAAEPQPDTSWTRKMAQIRVNQGSAGGMTGAEAEGAADADAQ